MISCFAEGWANAPRPALMFGRVLLLTGLLGSLACNDDGAEESDSGAPTSDAGERPDAGEDSGGGDAGGVTCTDKPGKLSGRSVQTLMAGGLPRRFIYYAPDNLDPNQGAPLLLVTHGFVMNGQMMEQISGFEAIADREGFVVIFPDGQGERAAAPSMDPPWNVGQDVCQPNGFPAPLASGDDQAFIDALLAFAREDRCIDDDHVFMTGFSMGGYFANESACVRSDLAGVAPHSAGSHDLSDCSGSIKPVLLMHFEQDALIPYSCGTEARDRWLARNGCDADAEPMRRTVSGGVCAYYKGCDEGGQVAMCTFDAPAATSDELFLGHAWSGGDTSVPDLSPFAIPETESAAELAWEFFKEHAW